MKYLSLFLFSMPVLAAQVLDNVSFDGPLGEQSVLSMTVITEQDIQQCPQCSLSTLLDKGLQLPYLPANTLPLNTNDSVEDSHLNTLFLVNGVPQNKRHFSLFWNEPVQNVSRIEVINSPFKSDQQMVVHIFTKADVCAPKELCVQKSQSMQETLWNMTFLSGGKKPSSDQDPAFQDPAWGPEFTAHPWGRGLNRTGSRSQWDQDESVVGVGTTWYLSPKVLFRSLINYEEGDNLRDIQQNRDLAPYKNRKLSIKLFGEYHLDFQDGWYYTVTTGVQSRKQESQATAQGDPTPTQDSTRFWTSLSGNKDPFAYQVAVRMDSTSGETKQKVWSFSGLASYKIAQVAQNEVFVIGEVGARRNPWPEHFLSHDVFSSFNPRALLDTEDITANLSEEFLSYEMGIRIERSKHIFLDVTAFQARLTSSAITNEGELRPLEPLLQNELENNRVQGLKAHAQFLFNPWAGGLKYIWTDTDHAEIGKYALIRHVGSVYVDYSATPRLSFGAALAHRGSYKTNNTDTNSQNILDIYSFYDINKQARFGVVLENATNEKYLQYYRRGREQTLWFRLELRH